jgi:hypothetical protein
MDMTVRSMTFTPRLFYDISLTPSQGIDLDWEYPGAPDRGGKDDDTKNYVELVKQLRATFDASDRKLGITFTAPSSYWYLRWFDLPGMLKHVDWINVYVSIPFRQRFVNTYSSMTYDLHGTWDSDNPIGNIVQGHTNLTEIGQALELFWLVSTTICFYVCVQQLTTVQACQHPPFQSAHGLRLLRSIIPAIRSELFKTGLRV